MLGKYGGINDIIRFFPLISQFRCPSRYKACLAFILSVFAAILIDCLAQEPRREIPINHWFVIYLPTLIAIALAVVAFVTPGVTFRNQLYAWGTVADRVYGPVLAGLTLLFFRLTLQRVKFSRQLLCALCILDLGVYGVPIAKNVDYLSFEIFFDAEQKMAQQNRLFRVLAQGNSRVLHGDYLANGFSGMAPVDPLFLGDLHHVRLASVSNAYKIGKTPFGNVEEKCRDIPDALPRFRLVTELRYDPAPLTNLQRIDLRTTVLVDTSEVISLDGPGLRKEESVKLIADIGDRLELELHAEYERILVVSDRWTPAWHVFVDGKERECLPLFAGALRGVRVGPGDKTVTFLYQSPVYAFGKTISIFGVVLVVTVTMLELFLSQRKKTARISPL